MKFLFKKFSFLLGFTLFLIGCPKTSNSTLPILGDMPEFVGIEGWINSPPLTKKDLQGKVVLIDFWTYSCINCLRTLPHLKQWYSQYKDQGFVIIGIHSPEFDFEKKPENVKKGVEKFGIPYPIALDSQMKTWDIYNNYAWPAHYFVDYRGRIRYKHFGEGKYEESEKVIRELLAEIPQNKNKSQIFPPIGLKTEQAQTPDFSQILSFETYLGSDRRTHFIPNAQNLLLNEWSLTGDWKTESERIILQSTPGSILFRFHAAKANLVLHPANAPIEAIVKIDGKIVSHSQAGRDVKNGRLIVDEPRLYELINLGDKGAQHTIEIEFLSPGVAAYAFTFG